MSQFHVSQLRSVKAEFLAARDSLRFTERNWDRYNIYREPAFESERGDLAQCIRNLERTYITRLFSTFEGLLREHLATAHPAISVPKDPKVGFFVSRVRRANGFPMSAAALDKIDRLRVHRNSLTHPGATQTETFTLDEALSSLNTYAAKIP